MKVNEGAIWNDIYQLWSCRLLLFPQGLIFLGFREGCADLNEEEHSYSQEYCSTNSLIAWCLQWGKPLALNEIRTTREQWTWAGPCLHTRLKKGTEELRKGRGSRRREGNKFYRGRMAEGLRMRQWGCGLELPVPWWEPSPPGLAAAAPELLLCQISLGREHLAPFCTISDTDQPLLVRLQQRSRIQVGKPNPLGLSWSRSAGRLAWLPRLSSR